MSQFHQVTRILLDLPVETLLEILGHLDVYELVRARQICNYVRQVIDTSSELRYLIELEYFNAIPVTLPGSVGTDVLRRSLRQSEFAWQNALYSSNILDPIPCPFAYQWSSGVLGFPGEELQQIIFLQPQLADSHSSAPTLRQWDCQVDSEVLHFNFSPAQDLAILITSASPGANHPYDVSFRSLSENNIHPDAAFAVVKALENEVDMEFFEPYTPKSLIFGDHYGALFKNVDRVYDGEATDFLQIWNWKSKDGFQCIKAFDPACEATDFMFLTNENLLVANARELSLYSLVHSSNALHLTAKFSLPPLQSPFEYEYFNFTPIPFPAQTHNQIITFSMIILGGCLSTMPCFTLFVERDTLLELESIYTSRYGKATEDSPILPWSSWGPNHTQCFEERFRDPCKHSVSGFRSVSLVGDWESEREPRPLCIRDFNPHRVADFKAWNGSSLNHRLVEGEKPSSNIFLEPLGSGLAYLESITKEEFVATDLNMEANRVTLLTFEMRRTMTMPQGDQESSFKFTGVQGFEVLDFQ